jgi:hypothetical protein
MGLGFIVPMEVCIDRIPETTERRIWRRFARPLHPGECIRSNPAGAARREHGNDVPRRWMSLSHPDGHRGRLVEEASAGRGDEELEDAVAAQHWFLAHPGARNLQYDVAPAHERHAAMGDDHSRREIDVVADEEDLPLPDDTVGLE